MGKKQLPIHGRKLINSWHPWRFKFWCDPRCGESFQDMMKKSYIICLSYHVTTSWGWVKERGSSTCWKFAFLNLAPQQEQHSKVNSKVQFWGVGGRMFQNGTRLSCLVGYGAFTYKNCFFQYDLSKHKGKVGDQWKSLCICTCIILTVHRLRWGSPHAYSKVFMWPTSQKELNTRASKSFPLWGGSFMERTQLLFFL
jgi:uncharacterized C2H2 Zn-finger protein